MVNSLCPKDVELFQHQGYLGPFELCPPDEMRSLRRELERLLDSPGPAKAPIQFRHLDSALTHDLCSHPAVVGRIASLLGPELVLWHSTFFEKPPGDIEVPWHQDGYYWPINPIINVSAWIAIDDATTGNGCLEVLPGSHKTRIPHINFNGGGRFRKRADPDQFQVSNPVNLEVSAGQFILFDAWLMHRSAANHSRRRRLALSARITVPTTRVDTSRYFPGYEVVRLSVDSPY